MHNNSIGVDIVENKRVSNIKLLQRILTTNEYNKYINYKDEMAANQFAAGRWAAKESIIKATNKKILFSEIEIMNDIEGKPIVLINGIENENILVSISHEKIYSIAFCILIG